MDGAVPVGQGQILVQFAGVIHAAQIKRVDGSRNIGVGIDDGVAVAVEITDQYPLNAE